MQFSIVLGAIFLLSLVFPSISHNPGKDYLVCKKLENIFDVESNINQSEITGNSRGKPGKRGPPGLKGPPGPTGPIGQVDYEKVNRILEERFLRIRRQLQCGNGVAINYKCFILPFVAGRKMNFQAAQSLCSFHGWDLAEVENATEYALVYQYIQRTWSVDTDIPQRTMVQVWLNMLYVRPQVMHSTGDAAEFVPWFPGYPRSTAGHDHMAFEVAISPQHPKTYNGMFNIIPTHSAIPLCSFKNDLT